MFKEIVSYVKKLFVDPYQNQDPYLKDTLKHLQSVEKELKKISRSGWNTRFFNRGFAKIKQSNDEFFTKYPLTEDDRELIKKETDIFSFIEKKGKSKNVHCLEDVLARESNELKENLESIDAYELLTKMYQQCFILNTSPQETIDIFFENGTMNDITYFTSSDFKKITHLMYKGGFIDENYRDEIIHLFLDYQSKETTNSKPDSSNDNVVYLSPKD